MGWSLGNVKDRYLHYGLASDAYVGRIVSGLDYNSSRFALLPPHFPSPISCEVTAKVFSSFADVPALERPRQFCLASLLFHRDFISSVVPRLSSLFSSNLFRNISLIAETFPVLSGISSPVLKAMGLPANIQTWLHEERLSLIVSQLPGQILSGMSEVMKENGIAAGNITTEKLEAVIRNLLDQQREMLMPASKPSNLGPSSLPSVYPVHFWASVGKFRRLPENFLFPDLSVSQAWLLWWEGNPEKQIPPFV